MKHVLIGLIDPNGGLRSIATCSCGWQGRSWSYDFFPFNTRRAAKREWKAHVKSADSRDLN